MYLLSLSNNPCPPFVTDGLFENRDGLKLRFARWVENHEQNRGTVCIFSGRGEFIEKYYEVVGELRKRKYSVAIFDWRCQGGSDATSKKNKKNYVSNFKKYDLDLHDFMKNIVLPFCQPPYIGLGHSMGGTILLRNLICSDTFFSRSVLTAPMIGIADFDTILRQMIIKLGLEFLCFLGLGRFFLPGKYRQISQQNVFKNNNLTSDYTRWKRTKDILDAAPQLKIGPPTFGWTKAALRALTNIQRTEYARKIKNPVLMFAAGADTIVSSARAEKLSNLMKNCTFVNLPHSLHEVLQERDQIRLQFWSAFDAYMKIEPPHNV